MTPYGDKKLFELFRDASRELAYPVGFDMGVFPDINKFNETHNKILIWFLPSTWVGVLTNQRRILKTYSFIYYVYQQDKQDSSNEDQMAIFNDTDFIATQYYIKLNEYLENNESEEFTITALNTTPILRDTTEILTGKRCTFTLEIPDDYPYCE